MSAVQDADALFARKLRGGLFEGIRMGLRYRHDGDDRFQEGICQSWYALRCHHERTGELLPDRVLTWLCRRRAMSPRDRFVPRGRTGGLDIYGAHGRRPSTLERTEGSPELLCAPPDAIEEAIDARRFVERLDGLDRETALGLLSGYTTREIGASTATSSATITRRTAGLRRRLQEGAHG